MRHLTSLLTPPRSMNVYQHTDKAQEPDKMLGGGGGGVGQYLSDDGQVFHLREIAELLVVSWEVKEKEKRNRWQLD